MSLTQKPIAAFILSLLSGIFIIVGGVLCSLWWVTDWNIGWMDGMMRGWEGTMHAWGLGGFAYMMGILGAVFGIIVIVSAIMLYVNPAQHEIWGALIIVFSVASIISCMGGMGIGLILGIIGGILALVYRPQKT